MYVTNKLTFYEMFDKPESRDCFLQDNKEPNTQENKSESLQFIHNSKGRKMESQFLNEMQSKFCFLR